MNASEYLKRAKGNAWLMNDGGWMEWNGAKWVVWQSGYGKNYKRICLFEGESLYEALKKMSEIQ